MRAVFRVDSSTKMGSGHVMRCLTLAEELEKNGSDVSFISRAHEGNLNHLISKKGFQIHELQKPKSTKLNIESIKGDNFDPWLGATEDKDAQDTIKAFGIDRPDWLIVDHYTLSEKWERTVRPTVKNIMVIDDLANRSHDCDLLLDQNWFQNMGTRYKDLVPANCTQLLGPEYALLRPEFSEVRKSLKQQKEKVDRIFVFFGGSDPHNLTGMTLRALSEPELVYLKVDVVIGGNNPHHHEIKKLTESRVLTYLHVQVDNMAVIMAKADLAIGSGGVNTWERMCLRLPALVISFADNHKVMLQDLVQHGHVNFLCHITKVDELIIKKGIKNVISDRLLIKNQRIKINKLVNGSGSQVIADWLIGDLSNQQFKVKNATDEDMELYWIWANDRKVRNNALNKERIPWDNHVKWFRSKLADKNCSLYLILADEKPIGQVRFEDEGDYARIDYSIACQFRGRKLGKKILDKAIKEYQKHFDKKVLGEVIPSNVASARTFESLGFYMEEKDSNKIYTKDAR